MKLLKKTERMVEEEKPGVFTTIGRHFGFIKKADATEKKKPVVEEEENTINKIKKNKKMLEEASGVKRLAYPRK